MFRRRPLLLVACVCVLIPASQLSPLLCGFPFGNHTFCCKICEFICFVNALFPIIFK